MVAFTTVPRMGSGRARYRAFQDGGMFHEGGFHLKGSDAVAAGFDYVVLSSHEPIEPVLVLFGEVACVVVLPAASGFGAFGIVLVACDEPVLVRTQADGDLPLRARGHGIFLVVHEVDVVEGAGFSGATADGLHEVECAQDDAGFRLTESLIDLVPRRLVELPVHLGVERFARRRAVGEGGKVVFGEILLDQKTVDGGRHAEGGDPVLRDEGKEVGRGEPAVVVVGKDRAPRYPLSVELAPTALRPARLCGGEMQTVVHHFLPEARVEDEARRIFEIVLHHLGHAGSARGEIAEHGIIPRRSGEGGDNVAHLGEALVKTAEPFHRGGEDAFFQGLALGEGVADVLYDVLFRGGDKQLDGGGITTVYDVLCGEQVSGGDDDGAQFATRDVEHPVLPSAVEHTHHVIALFHAGRDEEIDRAVAFPLHIGEGHDLFLAGGVAPHEGALFGGETSVFVHHVVAEIEIFGHRELHVFREIVVVGEIRAVEKFVKKIHIVLFKPLRGPEVR